MADKEGGGGGGIGSDFFLFVGIIVLFFFIWVAGGGPSRPISFQGPYLNPITNTGQHATAYGDPNSTGTISTGINIGGWGVGVSGTAGGTVPTNTSSLASSVTLLSDSLGTSAKDPKSEYLSIMVSPLAEGGVSTAGWRLVSEKTGKGAVFPQGTENPTSGRVNILSPITLKAGDTAIVVSGRSPVGVSFRENKCTGYFEERQDFKPSLAQNCPTPYQEYSAFYDDEDEDDECVTFVRSIPYCSTDTTSSNDVSASCENFVEDYLTYNGCVSAHQNDSGFYSYTWRVFLGSSDELWRSERETILLLDAQGKTIDSISY